jgi:CHAT domain-containing protein
VDLQIREVDSGVAEETFDVADLAPYKLLHLAAHANVNDQYPWQSSIRLASTGRVDRVSAADIATSRLRARLAVLAACESAGGRVLSGEGVLGLASAFISAGVPAVVATLWPVDDAQTARLMEHLYSGLAEGLNVATALQHARQSLRTAPGTRHPFFWAGYVLIGDGQIQVPLERRRPLSRIVPGVLAVGVFLSLLLSFRSRRR